MGTRWEWELVYKKVINDNEIPADKIPQYPPGVLDNVPPDFLIRTQYSSTHEGCVVLLYTDGREESPDLPGSNTYASYKGLPGKKIAFAGKQGGGALPAGQSVFTNCGFRDCINQQHLVAGPIYNRTLTGKHG